MRLIGTIKSETDVNRFAAWLIAAGVDVHVESGTGDQPFEIWVRREEQMEKAKEELVQFQENPSNPKYIQAQSRAAEIQREKKRKQQSYRKNIVKVGVPQGTFVPLRKTPLTMFLVFASIVVGLLMDFGQASNPGEYPVYRALLFNWTEGEQAERLFRANADGSPGVDVRLASIMRGEVWRIFTPMFIHYGMTHIVFNLMMLFQLGRILELRYGTFLFGLLVLWTAFTAHMMQALMPERLMGSDPVYTPQLIAVGFGGMSGVLYGLFGFAWVRSRLDPGSRLFVPQSTVFILIGWLFFCMTPAAAGLVGNVANLAHAAGLIGGIIAAFVTMPGMTQRSNQ